MRPPRAKSVGAVLVLTFLFGPLGLFYTGAGAAIVMLLATLVVGVVTLGVGLLLIWPPSMVWGAVSASNQHAEHQRWLVHYRPPHRAPSRPLPPPPVPPPPPPRPW